ncbi:ABC_transporter family protein [Hexamita inflata]|uniref:ABC transporter family protein n=1 Tax=Hexamita inflata TaxID=28002 RepID=A0AA86ND74_9EUKA|nr:ABC transporter family protein [Hexamita inflata]CAI9937729.1 ABC transporter family protein [Hexamita inflata]
MDGHEDVEVQHNKQTTAAQLWRQFKTMLRKDFIVTVRHPVLLVLELLVPAILFLTICDNRFTQPKMNTNYQPQDYSKFDLTKRSIAYYPSASQPMVNWIKCLETMYTDPANPASVPTSDQIVGFTDETEFKNFVLKNCSDCFHASFSFFETDPAQLMFNYTWRIDSQYIGDQEKGKDADRLYDFIIAENMAEYATTAYLAKHPQVKVVKNQQIDKVTMEVQLRKFPDVVYYDPYGIYNKMGSGAPVVLGISCIFSFFAFTYQIVSDKQMKLRQSLHTVGLRDTSFWASLFVVAVILAALQSIIICLCGLISGYVYFKYSPFLLNFFIIWLTFLASHTFAFLFGAIISQVKVLSFVIFAFLIGYFLLGSFCTNHPSIYPAFGSPSAWQVFFLTHSAQALYLISQKAIPFIDKYYPSQAHKFTWSDSSHFTGICDDYTCNPNGYDCGHTVAFCVCMLLVLCFVHLILAAYIDLVTPAAHGARLKLFEPFTPEFWGWMKQAPPPPSHVPGYQQRPALSDWDTDVKMESYKVLSPVNTYEFAQVKDAAVIIYDLNVKFKGMFSNKVKHAVNSLSLSIPRNSVLGLLGANGAGKTTTLSVITSQLRPTSGYIQVNGLSCAHQRRQVAEMLGYAPQFDILWPDLSPAEHIRIFADLRGLSYEEEVASIKNARWAAQRAGLAPLDEEDEEETGTETVETETASLQKRMTKKEALAKLIKMRLQDVALDQSLNTVSRQLSGGMRRRLTLCLALVGNPPVLLLDEISTGLDPISRRKIWDVILRSKTDRSVLLTTHSMEEADTLSDRLAIMAYGVLRCIGSSSRLKRKYGMGYRIDIQCAFDPILGTSDVLKVRDELVLPYIKDALLVGRTGGHLTLAVPRSVGIENLQTFLQMLEKRTDIIKSWGVRQTTLEEVFLAISRHAEKLEHLKQVMSD